MYHIAVYIPRSHVENVKEKMFEAGAGKLGNYEQCSFEYSGIGQFRPLPGSNPFIGSTEEVERVEEVKVEMICKSELLTNVITAMKSAHPYETPAYYAIEMVNI